MCVCVCVLVVRRRRRRRKERIVRLYRLSSPLVAPVTTTPRSRTLGSRTPASRTPASRTRTGTDSSWSAWRRSNSCSMHAEFNPNYNSVELLGLELAAVEHELNEIPEDCLTIMRSHCLSLSISYSHSPSYRGAPVTLAMVPHTRHHTVVPQSHLPWCLTHTRHHTMVPQSHLPCCLTHTRHHTMVPESHLPWCLPAPMQ